MKAKKVKVTSAMPRIPRGKDTVQTVHQDHLDWPRYATVQSSNGPVLVLVDQVTRLSPFDGRVTLYHATVMRRAPGYVRGQRVWVDPRSVTYVQDPLKADAPPTTSARRRARTRATAARKTAAMSMPDRAQIKREMDAQDRADTALKEMRKLDAVGDMDG